MTEACWGWGWGQGCPELFACRGRRSERFLCPAQGFGGIITNCDRLDLAPPALGPSRWGVCRGCMGSVAPPGSTFGAGIQTRRSAPSTHLGTYMWAKLNNVAMWPTTSSLEAPWTGNVRLTIIVLQHLPAYDIRYTLYVIYHNPP